MKQLFTLFFAWGFVCSHAQVFYENFESGATGWVEFDNGIGLGQNWVLTNDGFNSDWAAHIQYEPIGGSTSLDWLVSPLITPTAGNTTLSFFQKQSYLTDWGSVYTVRISTTSQTNPATFTTINTQTEANFGTSYTLKTVDLSAYINTPIYIAFVMAQDDGDDWFVDDVTVGPTPCFQPTNLTVYGQTATTSNFSWTDPNGSTQWEVAVVDANAAIQPADIVACPFNPVMMTGLTPGTDYDFYVRSVCGTARSVWTGPISFSTTCPATFTAPYKQSFNADTRPACWTESGSEPWNFSTDAGYAASSAGDYSGNGGNYAWIDGSAPSGASQISTLTSPRVNLTPLARPALYYRVFSHNTDGTAYNTLRVELYTGSAWVTLQTIQMDLGAGWKEYVVNLRNYTITGPVQVRFTVTENASSGAFYNDILIDDVEFKEGLNCYDPSNLTASGITANTASLSWSKGDFASTQWEVEIIEAGNAPTGTGTLTGSNPYLATGLMMATDYEYYVREVCGAGVYSNWVGPFAFTTLCGVYTAPYLQTFDDNTTPRCWSQSGDNPWLFSTNADYGAALAGDHTGNSGRYAWMDGSMNDNGEASALISPLVDISPLTNPALRYYVFSNNTDNSVLNTLYVEFFDGTSWTLVQTLQNNLGSGWFEVIINLSGYTITGPVRARFSVVGATAFGTWFHDILIDDVEFYEGPLCATPIALSATNITTSSADLGWGGGGTRWEVELSEANEALTGTGTGTLVQPYAATGLLSGTPYHFAVRRVCGAGDTSAWSAPFVFNTDCPSPLVGNTFASPIVVNDLTFTDRQNTAQCFTDDGAGASPDVWYQINLDNCTDTLELSLCGSSFDTYLYLYAADGTTLLSLNDDYCGVQSKIIQTVTPGTTVYALVEGFALETGEYELQIEQRSGVSAAYRYADSSYCNNQTNPTPTIEGNSGGAFSSFPAGLSLNAGTGVINLAASTPGNYSVVYTVVSGACTKRDTVPMLVESVPSAAFAYGASSYCQNQGSPMPTISGTSGGAFSSTSGLVLNSATGAIDLAASTPANYTINYTVGTACPATSSANVEVTAVPAANHTLTTQNIEACNATGPVTVRLSILGEDYDGYRVTRQWFNLSGVAQGSPQTTTIADNDNNPATPLIITKDTTVAQSGYFQFTVGVLRCGVPGAFQTVNSYIYAPTPAPLAQTAGTAQCFSTNNSVWIDFYEDITGEPIASLLDFTGAGDADTLRMTTVQLDFDPSVQICDGGALGQRPRLQRYWQMTPTNNRPAKVRLYLDKAEIDAMSAHLGQTVTIADFDLWKFADGTLCNATPQVVPFTLVDMGASSGGYRNDKPFVDVSNVIAIQFDVTSFSHFVLVPNASILAVDFVQFDAKALETGEVRLDWEVAMPHDYAQFEVFRSADAIAFEKVATVEAAQGQGTYRWLDEQPLAGTSYYYIKGTDWSGETKQTTKRAVRFENDFQWEVFPNPTSVARGLNIRFQGIADETATAEVIDALGRVVHHASFAVSVGIQTHNLPLPDLAKGVYVLRWTMQNGSVRRVSFVIAD